nr:hypothetical protein CFP56_04528 [Quercus suber]
MDGKERIKGERGDMSKGTDVPDLYLSPGTAPGKSLLDADVHVLLAGGQDVVLAGALEMRQLLDGGLDDLQRGLDLGLGDDERGREADDVLVGGFGLCSGVVSVCVGGVVLDVCDLERAAYQQSLFLHQHAEVPRAVPARLGLVDDDGVHQAPPADHRDRGVPRLDVAQALAEHLAERLRALDEVLFLDDLEGFDRDGRAERVAAVGRAVGAGLDGQHDGFAAEDAGDGVHASRDGFAEEDQVGLDATPFVAEQPTGPRDTGLDLIADEQDVVFGAELPQTLEVAVVGYDDAGFALDRLDQDGGRLLAVCLEQLFDRVDVVVRKWLARGRIHTAEIGEVWAVVVSALRVAGQGDGRKGAAVEVLLQTKDPRLVRRDALDLVCPFPRNLDGRLDRFRASVHGQHHLEPCHGRDLLGKLGEDIVVEGSTAQGQAGGLLGQGLDQLGVAMALVDGRVGGEKVEVVLALGIPDRTRGRLGEDDGERVVVVRGEVGLGRHGGVGGRGMVGRGCGRGRSEGGGFDVESVGGGVAVGVLIDGHGRHGGEVRYRRESRADQRHQKACTTQILVAEPAGDCARRCPTVGPSLRSAVVDVTLTCERMAHWPTVQYRTVPWTLIRGTSGWLQVHHLHSTSRPGGASWSGDMAMMVRPWISHRDVECKDLPCHTLPRLPTSEMLPVRRHGRAQVKIPSSRRASHGFRAPLCGCRSGRCILHEV